MHNQNQQHHQNNPYTGITWEHIQEALPQHTEQHVISILTQGDRRLLPLEIKQELNKRAGFIYEAIYKGWEMADTANLPRASEAETFQLIANIIHLPVTQLSRENQQRERTKPKQGERSYARTLQDALNKEARQEAKKTRPTPNPTQQKLIANIKKEKERRKKEQREREMRIAKEEQKIMKELQKQRREEIGRLKTDPFGYKIYGTKHKPPAKPTKLPQNPPHHRPVINTNRPTHTRKKTHQQKRNTKTRIQHTHKTQKQLKRQEMKKKKPGKRRRKRPLEAREHQNIKNPDTPNQQTNKKTRNQHQNQNQNQRPNHLPIHHAQAHSIHFSHATTHANYGTQNRNRTLLTKRKLGQRC